LAGPTLSRQHQHNLCRDVARPLVDVEPPITKRMLATDYRRIVPSHVAEPGGIPVHATIEMHDHAEFGVADVVVFDMSVDCAPALPNASREAVGPLDVSVITQFEQTVIAGGGVAEGGE
jgi:hypothetical protein